MRTYRGYGESAHLDVSGAALDFARAAGVAAKRAAADCKRASDDARQMRESGDAARLRLNQLTRGGRAPALPRKGHGAGFAGTDL